MIKQIISIIFITLWTVFSTYGFITPFLVINQEKMFVETLKKKFKSFIRLLDDYIFDLKGSRDPN
jgi:hypothetical protein